MPALRILTLHLAQAIRCGAPGENSGDCLKAYTHDPAALPPLGKEVELSGPGARTIGPGDYLFAQWAEGSFETPEEGLAAFALQAAQLPRTTEGHWLLRMLMEEGKTACQALRRLA
ncbi:MAG: hypothetical protein AB1407_10710 [Spirochaetota bacterium]